MKRGRIYNLKVTRADATHKWGLCDRCGEHDYLVRITKLKDDEGNEVHPHFHCQPCLADLIEGLHQWLQEAADELKTR